MHMIKAHFLSFLLAGDEPAVKVVYDAIQVGCTCVYISMNLEKNPSLMYMSIYPFEYTTASIGTYVTNP